MMQITSINAFTHGALKGNPAGVCEVSAFPEDAVMQRAAHRMGHAETAFLVKLSTNHYALRWFTPTTEVALCGHGTLAAAHFLRESHLVDGVSPVQFATASGTLTARYDGAHIYLTLPTKPGDEIPITARLEACLGVTIRTALRNDINYLVEVADIEALRNCSPNLHAIASLDSEDLIVTCIGTDGYDYAYRCFCPQVGIDEDPVTGSANCILAPFWAARLGRITMKALQTSTNGGALNITLNQESVEIGGEAQTVSISTIDFDVAEAA